MGETMAAAGRGHLVFCHPIEEGDGPVEYCGCYGCLLARQTASLAAQREQIQALAAERDKALESRDGWRQSSEGWKASHAEEMEQRCKAEDHRDRLIESNRELRAEIEKLKVEAARVADFSVVTLSGTIDYKNPPPRRAVIQQADGMTYGIESPRSVSLIW